MIGASQQHTLSHVNKISPTVTTISAQVLVARLKWQETQEPKPAQPHCRSISNLLS